ncbi:T9SS C-terminal target domain-containing protein [Flavobacterium subsaxonicum]|uniref:PKD domain-containing protein n=1 Tax=Flavobacterium subsaxonicum WB 4.1-42 = DSM 21790 TaxID=1121898 RepID=A0A0A2N373_9FLAO|nr:T9SS C-terminal target domain-containing protein [Flavobacterium subsaxonicum]KGO94910.1 hypothetical protein Q766_01990 [Flavobacterium subsaxonicum WB 4.1-42 = DSM 21790]
MKHTTKKPRFLTLIKKLSCIAVLLCSFAGFAQKQGAIWYFGGFAGLDFNSGAPAVLTDNALSTGEGCSTISDANGNLLFYTNGVKIYNKNHQVMANGGDLQGSISSSQAAIIVKKPLAADIYYIFTTQSFDGYMPLGLNFYEVDMSLNNGLGQMVAKNWVPAGQPNPAPIYTPVAEKITAVKHADGEKVWVITHGADNSQDFVAYLISSTGVSTTPVISSVGTVYDNYFIPVGLLEENNLTGCLKASPDGTKLASAIGYNSSMFVTTPLLTKGLELLDFDAATGVVSNAQMISTLKSYGVEFSPNSQVLYASSTTSLNPNQIYQYDVTLATTAAIQASQTLITTQAGIGTLQLGIDGKLYGAKLMGGSALHVINKPNVLGGACDFQGSAVPLGSASCYNGLPNFLTSLFAEEIEFNGVCAGSPTMFNVSPYSNIQSATWNFGDPTSGTANTSTNVMPSHTYSQGGTYTVTVDFVSFGGQSLQITDTVIIAPAPVANTAPNLTVCQNQASALFNLTAQTAVILGTQLPADYTVTYHTTQADADAGTNALTGDLSAYSSTGQTIYVRVIKNAGSVCYSTTSFQLIIAPQPVANPVGPLTLCDTGAIDGFTAFNLTQQESTLLGGQTGLTVAYYTSQANAEAGTSPIVTQSTFTNTTNPQTIYVALTNTAGCKAYTLFTVSVTAAPVLPALPNLQSCDVAPTDGFAAFNLTQQSAALLAGQTGATVAYYTGQANAEAGANPIVTPSAFTNTTNPQTIYAVVTNAADCFSIATFNLEVTPVLQLPQVANLQTCDTGAADGFTSFNLAQYDAALLAGQTGATVAYYTSQANAEAGTSPIVTPSAFTNTVNPQTIYVAVTTAAGCQSYTTFTVNVFAAPAVVALPSIEICDGDVADGKATFNLTQQDAALLAGQTGVTIAYFTSQADADANSNAIANATAFVNTAAPQTIYVRVSNATCYATTSFTIDVLDAPQINNDLVLEGCSPFNLTDVAAQLTGGLTLSYYPTQSDALAGTNAIATPAVYALATNSGVVYIHAQNTAGCYTVAPLNLESGNCTIQRGISPNNDGLNDSFDLSGFQINNLEIFNRYGKEVYSKTHYSNEWYGQTDGGDELPTGTYYYVINFSDAPSKTGWIYINRQN